MAKCAAVITTPVTNAAMQENSTTSITSSIICTPPLHRLPAQFSPARP
jgi:hypothetical protein